MVWSERRFEGMWACCFGRYVQLDGWLMIFEGGFEEVSGGWWLEIVSSFMTFIF